MADQHRVQAVVFDVGETLVDETRVWADWADRLGISRLTLMALLGATIERGDDHLEAFRILRPEYDLHGEARRLVEAGDAHEVSRADLYPDAEPTLAALHGLGYRLGIVGNQPSRTEAVFRALDVPVELVATSSSWGLEKPDPRFFERIVSELALDASEIAYVGDRLDNDVGPAARAGMVAIFVRRGPWAWIRAGRGDPPEAALVVESLAELPAALGAAGGTRP